MADLTRSADSDDVTSVQSPAVRDFNQRLAEAYMRPGNPPPAPPPPPKFLDDPGVTPPAARGSSMPGNPPSPPETLDAPSSDRSGRARRAAEQQQHPRKSRRLIVVIAALGALLLGVLLGYAFASDGEPETAPLKMPAPVATSPTASASPSSSESQQVEELTTPYSCIEALDQADKAFEIIKQALTSDLWRHRGELADVASKYRYASAACREQE